MRENKRVYWFGYYGMKEFRCNGLWLFMVIVAKVIGIVLPLKERHYCENHTDHFYIGSESRADVLSYCIKV